MPDPTGAAAARPHIVLVGLMGSGKSTVGKKLAKLIGYRFVDADVVLEERTGRSVATWFAEEGEAGFRGAEAELLAALLDETDPLVVGAGGGVVVTEANRTRLAADDAVVVYLDADPAFLASRVKAKPHRPLLAEDPLPTLTRMFADRDAWYRQVADIEIPVRPAHEAGEKPKWQLAETIAAALVDRGILPAAAVRSPAEVAS